MQNSAVIRLISDQLAWYSPGAGDPPRLVNDKGGREQLLLAMSQPGSTFYFAAPGADVRLCQLEVSAPEKKHIQKSLPFTLEEGLIDDVEDLHFASEMQGKSTIHIGVVSKAIMRHWQGLLADFPGVNQWVPEPLMLPWKEGEWSLLIEDETALVRLGIFDGFSVETALLLPMLKSSLSGERASPQAIVVYGQDQGADTALLPEELQDVVRWRRGGFAAALMLAQAPDSSPNLLQGEFGQRLPLGRWWKQWRAVAAIFAVAFCVQLAATYIQFSNLEQENLELRHAIEQSYRKAYPRGAMVDPQKQLSRQLGALRGSTQTGGFVSLMNRVGDVINSNPGTRIASINYNDKGDEIRMNITAQDFETVENIRTAMNKSGLDAKMESSSAQGDQVRARLRVGAGS